MRLIDADVLKELILKERDAIPKIFVERYSFGVEIPNSHGNSMCGGIRKALRCMEQTPTIAPESLRPKGWWVQNEFDEIMDRIVCSHCKKEWNILDNNTEEFKFCPNCGAKMEG